MSTPSTSTRPPFWTTIGIVAKREIITRFLSKSFLISTAITLVVFLGLMVFIPRLGKLISGTTTVATTAELAPTLSRLSDINVTEVVDEAAARKLVSSEEVKAAVVPDAGNPTGLKLIALSDPPETLTMKLSVSPSVELLDPDAPNPGLQSFLNIGFGLVWMMAALTGMSIAQSVVEEKQTRIVEILLASISSKALLTGKILGNSAAALTQIAAIAGTVFLGAAINGESIPLGQLTLPILWFIVLFLFGFVMIAALFAAAAALVSRSEDLSNTIQPIMWIVMLPYFGVASFGSNPLAMQIMSYIPFSAPVAVPLRVFREQGAAWEPFLSIVILIATSALITWFAARIYERGPLRTGKPIKWKEALTATD